ncbi:preprotein translocase subunit SecA [Sphaerochaeta halotolerans]|jgi:preprotein translocase subunit SecA|uniref:Protein translocase subunit SecA n=1 Tax=Sphaerochaeta halotolerans TaxID=2293840 RepID=A0A372MDH8_9SPIR|nr:preprotein translocase subunit SecA [Sphaerochaeta halotolerans]MBG0766838.1 preprotein translocase subunit SecA [Spirochaetaceae bacterium]MDK2858993.1 preprotein translocase subunit SecA [Sphaerochaeta sp.]MXI86305.1 preprotein translocase subunit SecA [Sphaerochaeta halotolerans]RFU93847.1 preprotein translocase subunit SecA [Sphaerochaeta halotolerans]
MSTSLFTKLFGTKQDKDLKSLMPVVELVNKEAAWAESLSAEEVRQQTQRFKEQVAQGASLDSLLPKAFALAREAASRVLGERHYDVQIMGAAVLHQGKILEMKTGEGKTLTCVPAAYLNALSGNGVHVVTVNDYLAGRDASWMGPIYEYLGLSVGVILSSMDNEAKRNSYSKDVTYGTNNEFGFDYLRDNMKWSEQEKIQPKHHYCIIDEIDSILIDEARTPLIISGQSEDDSAQVLGAAKVAPLLTECEKNPDTGDYYEPDPLARFDRKAPVFDEHGDYKLDEKQKRVLFTNQGMNHIEELLNRYHIINGSLYEDENFEYVHYVTQAVKALRLYTADVDYVVAEGQVQIVDEFTGRILHGRRYSEGLHQAIEAKEKIKILGQNKTLATITYQNFFRMYDKISGMTGTADTEAPEFLKIYNLDVVVIPTNKPIIRKDYPDLVYYNEEFKFKAICEEIQKVHSTGQPILVGTISIEKSELLSVLLRRMGIKHEVLNAKNHAREALIIENAGAKGAVTIATNMAGRGTDIKLGGSLDARARALCGADASPEEFNEAIKKVYDSWKHDYEEVKELGGLYILGTERHESRRIDNQLRGRSGRQGDPGASRFFVSLEDSLMRLFASENLKNMLGRIGMQDGEPIEHRMLSNAIEKAQKRVEDRNFEIRKHLLDYDDVLNEQRNYLYKERDTILSEEHLLERVRNICHDISDEMVDQVFSEEKDDKKGIRLFEEMLTTFHLEIPPLPEHASAEEYKQKLREYLDKEIDDKVALTGEKAFNDFLRFNYLRQIDLRWQDHLTALEDLRDAVGLRSYAQRNPLVEYKVEGFEIFTEMLDGIKRFMAQTLVRVKITKPEQQYRQKAKEAKTVETHQAQGAFGSAGQGPRRVQGGGDTAPVTVRRQTPKVGRNDPCPCGSGKKYKYCCGRNA